MQHRALLPISLAFGLVALAPSAGMAQGGVGGGCVTITREVDGQPWLGDSHSGVALTNETKNYTWIDHNHVCLGVGPYMPPRPPK